RQKKKFGLALEHLKFAGAEKLVREVEAEMRPPAPPPKKVITEKIVALNPDDAVLRGAMEHRTQPGKVPTPPVPPSVMTAVTAEIPKTTLPDPAAITAARKLQDA